MSETLEELVIPIRADDQASAEVAAAVERIKAEIKELSATKARIKVEADTADARRKIEELKAKEKELAAEEKLAADARAKSSAQQASADTKALKRAQAKRQAVQQELTDNQKLLQSLNRLGDATKTAQKTDRLAAAEARRRDQAAAKAASDRAREAKQALADTDRQSRLADKAAAAMRKSEAAESKAAAWREGAAQREQQMLLKRIELQQRFTAAEMKARSAGQVASRAQGVEKFQAELDGTKALRQLEVLKMEMAAIGAKPIELRTKMNKSDLSTAERDLGRVRGVLSKVGGSGVGKLMGFDFPTNQIEQFGRSLKGTFADLNKTKVNILGMSIGLKSLGVALVTLAPMITGLVGALGSLVSVAGAGLVGALGVGAAAAAGFGMAGLGITAMLHPQIQAFSLAHASIQKYQKAVADYGPKSKQAAAAQKQMNNAIAAAPAPVRQALLDMNKLSSTWRTLTKGTAQRDFGKIMGDAMGVAKTGIKQFAADSKTALNQVTTGFHGWAQSMKSPAIQGAFHNIFQNFNKSIPNIMAGLGSLGGAMTHIASAFSNALPGLSGGFAKWAQHIDDATKNGTKMNAIVKETVGAMKDVGHFAEAAGRFLVSFFKAGIGPGRGFLDSMTHGLNKLTASMNTVGGQNKLTNFFQRSINTTKQLFGALMPLISAFTQFAQALAPVSAVALNIVSSLAKVVAAFVGFKPLQYLAGFLVATAIITRLSAGLLEAGKLIGGFGGKLYTVAKTMSAMGPIGAFKGAFGSGKIGVDSAAIEAALVSGSETGAAAMEAGIVSGGATAAAAMGEAVASGGAVAATEEAAGAAAGGTGGAVIGAGEVAAANGLGVAASKAAPEVAALTAETAALTPETAGLGAIMVAAAPELLAVGAAAAVVTGAFLLFGNQTSSAQKVQDELNKSIGQTNKIFPDTWRFAHNAAGAINGLAANQGTLASSQQNINSLTKQANKLYAQGKTNTQQYKDVMAQLTPMINDQNNARQAQINGINKVKTGLQQQVKQLQGPVLSANKTQQDALVDVNKKQGIYNSAVKDFGRNSSEANITLNALHDAQARYAAAVNNATNATGKQQNALERLTAVNANLQRAVHGWGAAIPQSALQSVGSLLDRLKAAGNIKGAHFLLTLPNPNDIVKITNLMNTLKGVANGKAAFKILGDSSSADQAISRLNALVLNQKKIDVTANIGNTVATLLKINGIKLTPKEVKMLHSGDPAVIAAVAKINGLPIPPKLLKLLGDATDANNKHAQVVALQNIQKYLTILGEASSAMNAIGGVLAALAGVQSKSVSIDVTTNYRTTGAPPHGGAFPATGGFIAAAAGGTRADIPGLSKDPVLFSQQKKAIMDAARRPAEVSRVGGMYKKPIYLVGEENRPEYVISTNPAYRKRNAGFLADAAREFGMNLTMAAGGTAPKHHGTSRQHGHTSTSTHHTAKAAKNPSFNGLPAKDRIGGVGVADIQQALTTAQSTARGLNTGYNNDKKYIADHARDKKKPSGYGVRQGRLKSEKKALDAANRKAKAIQGILNDANSYIGRFTNLESAISTVGAYENTANTLAGAGLPDIVDGYDFAWNGKDVVKKGQTRGSWQYWHTELLGLEQHHADLLKAAVDDARKKVKEATASATQLGYVRTLENAYGTAFETETTDALAVEATKGGSIADTDVVAAMGNVPGQRQSWADYLGTAQTKYAIAEANLVTDPVGGPAAAADTATESGAALQEIATWTSALKYAQTNYPKDYSLISQIAGDLGTARTNYANANQAAAAVGPSQAQLQDTARGLLYQSFGSNVGGPIYAGAASAAPTTAALAGSVASGQAAATSGASAGSTYNINNHFSQPPSDPHSWSQSLAWETAALV